MMGETLFTALVALFWVSEFAFAAVVVYWFVTQGFADDDATADGLKPLESRRSVRRSLAVWGGFFLALVLLIVVGA